MIEKEIVELHADDCIGRHTEIIGIAIICASTGILCTAQVAGIACRHPKIEGYIIPLHSFNTEKFIKNLESFNDCDWGCDFVYNKIPFEGDKERRNDYANAVDSFLKENFNNKNAQQMLSYFDYDRIDELTEGWWPVLIQFSDCFTNKPYDTRFKGYLHFGNCD